jgi:hypothetical protein
MPMKGMTPQIERTIAAIARTLFFLAGGPPYWFWPTAA